MSITNLGSQHTIFEYKTQANGAEFSKFLRGVVKPGIYSGGAVTATTPGVGSELVLAAFNAIFNCDSDKIAHTTTAATITATMPPGKNVWYMTYAYLPVVENWIDFGYRVDTDPAVANEIIICKCTWSGALYTGNVTAIDYTYRTFGLYDSTYNARFDKNVAVDGVVTIANVTDSSTKDTGCLIVEGGIGVEKTLTTGGKVLVKDTTSSTTKDTGCVIVEGGVGIEENLNVGGTLNVSGRIKDTTGYVMPEGTTLPFAGISAPTGFLLCDGSAVSRATYASLFAALKSSKGACTFTDAGDVVTFNGHGLATGDCVYFSVITDTTNISIDTNYYVIYVNANAFTIATTFDLAIAGTKTTFATNGTGTLIYAPWGISTSANFKLPDGRGLTMKGVGQHGTASWGAAAYTGNLGHYKQDKSQGHRHDINDAAGGGAAVFGGFASFAGSRLAAGTAGFNVLDPTTDGTNGTPRTGTTTEMQSFGVNFIIKY